MTAKSDFIQSVADKATLIQTVKLIDALDPSVVIQQQAQDKFIIGDDTVTEDDRVEYLVRFLSRKFNGLNCQTTASAICNALIAKL